MSIEVYLVIRNLLVIIAFAVLACLPALAFIKFCPKIWPNLWAKVLHFIDFD